MSRKLGEVKAKGAMQLQLVKIYLEGGGLVRDILEKVVLLLVLLLVLASLIL